MQTGPAGHFGWYGLFIFFSKKVRKIAIYMKDFFRFHRTYIIYKEVFWMDREIRGRQAQLFPWIFSN